VSRILLDTSAYSAFMRGHGPIVTQVRRAEEIYVNAVILGELLAGFRRGRRAENNRAGLSSFLASSRVRVLPMNLETAQRYAVITQALRKKRKPIPTNDIWIAASAMERGLVIVTTDSHFQQVAQVVVDHHPHQP